MRTGCSPLGGDGGAEIDKQSLVASESQNRNNRLKHDHQSEHSHTALSAAAGPPAEKESVQGTDHRSSDKRTQRLRLQVVTRHSDGVRKPINAICNQ